MVELLSQVGGVKHWPSRAVLWSRAGSRTHALRRCVGKPARRRKRGRPGFAPGHLLGLFHQSGLEAWAILHAATREIRAAWEDGSSPPPQGSRACGGSSST